MPRWLDHIQHIRMKLFVRVAGLLLFLFALLSIPFPERTVPASAEPGTFAWEQDSVWVNLEVRFLSTRNVGCDLVNPTIRANLAGLDSMLFDIDGRRLPATAAEWTALEARVFQTGADVAACTELAGAFANSIANLRTVVKRQSEKWDLESLQVRRSMYRLLYGSRAALEEVLIQAGDADLALQMAGKDTDYSVVPSAMVHGVRIESGDLLVSRGGYPTSALISRGSDYPGNFSHVALAHVSDAGEVSVVEAHIERGLAVATAEQYLADKKLRLMVLRMRRDQQSILDDPRLPHRAAEYALNRARTGHVPYDFEMNYRDPSKLFCSEVASDAYGAYDVTLWTGISTISAAGLRRWLGAFGVKYFETEEPSDLEYDPQLEVIAEWRDPADLLMDRIDNAVVDAMLETAERGQKLDYSWYYLAPGRLAKAYSVLLNLFGGIGPVPEGMSAASALRNKAFTMRHDALADRVSKMSSEFMADNGYHAPYWKVLQMARTAVSGHE